MRALLPALAVLLAGCIAAPGAIEPAGDAAAPTLLWQTLTPTSEGRTEVAAATIGSEVVIVGGFTDDGAATRLVEAYDAAKDAWRRLPDYPVPIHHAAAVAIDGEDGPRGIYVFGGWASPPVPAPDAPIVPATTPLAFRLDPDGGSWTPVAKLPAPRAGHAAAVVDGKIYLVGGINERFELTPVVDVYDPKADAWSTVADIPTPRDHTAAVAMDGKVYVVAGQTLSHALNVDAMEAFDPATGEWERLAPIPTARDGHAVVAWNGRIVAFGGQTDKVVFSEVEAYDPAADAWTTFPPLPTPRHGLAAGVVGDRAFVILGGTIAGSPLDLSPAVEVLAEA